MKRVLPVTVLVLGLVFLGEAPAAINPNFTPVHLVQQSEQVVVLKLAAPDAKGKITAQVVRLLKGKLDAKSVTIDLSASPFKEHGKTVGKAAAELGEQPALLFLGQFKEEGQDQGNQKKPEAFMHLAGKWVSLYRDAKAPKGEPGFGMDQIDNNMEATWAGGTDMLVRCVEYVGKDPDVRIPSVEGAAWKKPVKLGKVDGAVSGLEAIELKGDGDLFLFVAVESGDKLYQFDVKAKEFKEVTAALKLGSQSRCAAWADLNGDGLLDLASWDGKALVLWLQGESGTFQSQPVKWTGPAPRECLGLAVLDVGGKAGAGLLVSTGEAPLLLKPQGSGAFASAPLAAGKSPDGPSGRCLVADLDGDGWVDVLQPFGGGSLFCKGTAPGIFAPGTESPVALGKGRSGAFLGDFDADGLLDVYCLAEDGCRLWHNQGGGKFIETFQLTGEPVYIAQPGGFAGVVGDVNNDGRQDILQLYTKLRPLIFFNRGYRSFGHAHMLDLEEQKTLGAASQGQQAGVLADFNRDGTQDLALVLNNGELWFLGNELSDGDPLHVRAVLPPGVAGPVTVTATSGDRPLGAWNVTAGGPGAFLGRQEAGAVKLRWRLPGGTVQEKEVIVEKRPVRFVLK